MTFEERLENAEVALEEYRIKNRHLKTERGELIKTLEKISNSTLTKAQMRAIAKFHLLQVRGIV